ncbi:hypothetical protein [Cellulomonas alba]|uniref:Uncharacterized protein n=1 Tax=Cellulomonas alba TaxID=3053467 RepID=A0ABT7SEF9_9CELL|nr:hypothetical protein [Cellulomonas alba]MDM7854575.1 hypothetical protein [Cellulomonas alba]
MAHASGADLAVVALVVRARLVDPLLIGRFPLPAILASLVVDGIDKSVLQAFTHRDLTDYQSYDKALDVYSLAVTYLAVRRTGATAPAQAAVGRRDRLSAVPAV